MESPFSFAAGRLWMETRRHSLMSLSRKDFLLRSAAAVLPVSVAARPSAPTPTRPVHRRRGVPSSMCASSALAGTGSPKTPRPSRPRSTPLGPTGAPYIFRPAGICPAPSGSGATSCSFSTPGPFWRPARTRRTLTPTRSSLQVVLRRRDHRFPLRVGAGAGRRAHRDHGPGHHRRQPRQAPRSQADRAEELPPHRGARYHPAQFAQLQCQPVGLRLRQHRRDHHPQWVCRRH